MSYAVLGKELLPTVFLLQAIFDEHTELKKENARLKAAEEVALSRAAGSRGTGGGGGGGSTVPNNNRPGTMGELAKRRMSELD
jgi:hypothetical protein